MPCICNVVVFGVNLRDIPGYIPAPIKNINWKVAGVITAAFSALVVVAFLFKRSASSTLQGRLAPPAPKPLKPFVIATTTDLGFTPEQLNEIVRSGKLEGRTFGSICDDFIKKIKEEMDKGNKTVVFRYNQREDIFDLSNLGLPSGKTCETAGDEELEKSWVSRILDALKKKSYIRHSRLFTLGIVIHGE